MNLRDFTMARVQLDRAGSSLATNEVLRFQLAHAAARDAVHAPLDTRAIQSECEAHGWPATILHSAASDRATYLRRPDLGRRLRDPLAPFAGPVDLAIIMADGLSALAINRHAVPLLTHLLALIHQPVPLFLVEQGRVAIADEIGEALQVRISLVLIGERPGLTSADSLGAYLTWSPCVGRTDAERNCISNIRPEGLGYEAAAVRIHFLINESMRRKLSGVALKENLGSSGSIAQLP